MTLPSMQSCVSSSQRQSLASRPCSALHATDCWTCGSNVAKKRLNCPSSNCVARGAGCRGVTVACLRCVHSMEKDWKGGHGALLFQTGGSATCLSATDAWGRAALGDKYILHQC